MQADLLTSIEELLGRMCLYFDTASPKGSVQGTAREILALIDAGSGEGWRDIATAPIGQRVTVSSHCWDGVMSCCWRSEDEKERALRRWINPPTVWMPCPELPPVPQPRDQPAERESSREHIKPDLDPSSGGGG